MPCIDTVQGFSFCPAVYQLLTIVYGCLSAVNAIIPPQRQNRLQGFTGLFRDLPHSSAHNTADTQAFYAPSATRWRAYCQALHLRRYQIPPPRWTLYSSKQPPIIIRYIRVQRCALLWIHARRCSIAQTMPTRRLAIWHRSAVRAHRVSPAPSTRRDSPAVGARRGGRRGTIDGYRRISFRAFAR